MQRKTKRKFDIITIIVNIIQLIFMILCITTKNNNYYAWYWIIVPIMLVCEVWYVHMWDKVGAIDLDKKESTAIRYSFDGMTVGTIVISGLLFLSVTGLEMINKSIKDNIFVIILVYIMLTISLLCNLLAVYSANNDTRKLVEKTYNKKK